MTTTAEDPVDCSRGKVKAQSNGRAYILRSLGATRVLTVLRS
jgi:hypothetical protein